MTRRITNHKILGSFEVDLVTFYWNGGSFRDTRGKASPPPSLQTASVPSDYMRRMAVQGGYIATSDIARNAESR